MKDETSERIRTLLAELFPLCRSITGHGVRETLRTIASRIPIQIHEVPTGTQVLDWTVPDEWNIRDAFVARRGERIIDFAASNLHLVSYSEPIRREMTLEELRPHLHTHPHEPDWIPYRTSYYERTWGFCLAQRQLERLEEGMYEVVVDSTLEPGFLTYGECVLPGASDSEVLLTTHICHPSLANDNLSGIALLVELATALAEAPRLLTYRLLFIPGTIGSITWLAQSEATVGKVVAGVVVACVGDQAPLTYKRSRRSSALVDRAFAHVLERQEQRGRVVDFVPWGWDERQFNSPGFDLPVGSLSRSREGEYDEYHSSADDLDFVSSEQITGALGAVLDGLRIVEGDRTYVNLAPKGEPQLGRRGLYPGMGGGDQRTEQLSMLWLLNQSDGSSSILDIAERSGIAFRALAPLAERLVEAGLLADRDSA